MDHDSQNLELDELAQQLALLRPASTGLNRDQLMYEAGRASARNASVSQGGVQRPWQALLWTMFTTTASIVMCWSWWHAESELLFTRSALQQALASRPIGSHELPPATSELITDTALGSELDSDWRAQPVAEFSWFPRSIHWLSTGLLGQELLDPGGQIAEAAMLGLRDELIGSGWDQRGKWQTLPVFLDEPRSRTTNSQATSEAVSTTAGGLLRQSQSDLPDSWWNEESQL